MREGGRKEAEKRGEGGGGGGDNCIPSSAFCHGYYLNKGSVVYARRNGCLPGCGNKVEESNFIKKRPNPTRLQFYAIARRVPGAGGHTRSGAQGGYGVHSRDKHAGYRGTSMAGMGDTADKGTTNSGSLCLFFI